MLKITAEHKWNGSGRWVRLVLGARHILVLGLVFTATSYGQPSSFAQPSSLAQPSSFAQPSPSLSPALLIVDGSAQAAAFGKYLASIQERNPFTESGPVDVEIEAVLPGLAKSGRMLAVRDTSASERSEYSLTRFDGDSTVKQQVIARYLEAQEQAEALPYSSVAVTPVNYKFRYLCSLETSAEEKTRRPDSRPNLDRFRDGHRRSPGRPLCEAAFCFYSQDRSRARHEFAGRISFYSYHARRHRHASGGAG
jgi:hypothetical protein